MWQQKKQRCGNPKAVGDRLDGSKPVDFPEGFSTGSSLSKKHITGWWCNNHLEKYEFVNGKDDIPYMKWKIIHSCLKHFETTNQISVVDDLRSGSERFPLWDPILEDSESKYIHATVQWTPAVTQPPPPPHLQHHSAHGSMFVGDPQRSQWRARWHLPRWCHGGRKVGNLEMREMASNYPGNTFGKFFGEGFFLCFFSGNTQKVGI